MQSKRPQPPSPATDISLVTRNKDRKSQFLLTEREPIAETSGRQLEGIEIYCQISCSCNARQYPTGAT